MTDAWPPHGPGYTMRLSPLERRAYFWDRVYLDYLHSALEGKLGPANQAPIRAAECALDGARLALKHYDKEAPK